MTAVNGQSSLPIVYCVLPIAKKTAHHLEKQRAGKLHRFNKPGSCNERRVIAEKRDKNWCKFASALLSHDYIRITLLLIQTRKKYHHEIKQFHTVNKFKKQLENHKLLYYIERQ